MPYALDVAGGESAGKRAGERKKREPEGEEEADSGPWVHLSPERALCSRVRPAYIYIQRRNLTFCPEP